MCNTDFCKHQYKCGVRLDAVKPLLCKQLELLHSQYTAATTTATTINTINTTFNTTNTNTINSITIGVRGGAVG